MKRLFILILIPAILFQQQIYSQTKFSRLVSRPYMSTVVKGKAQIAYEKFEMLDNNTVLLIDSSLIFITKDQFMRVRLDKSLHFPLDFAFDKEDSTILMTNGENLYKINCNGKILCKYEQIGGETIIKNKQRLLLFDRRQENFQIISRKIPQEGVEHNSLDTEHNIYNELKSEIFIQPNICLVDTKLYIVNDNSLIQFEVSDTLRQLSKVSIQKLEPQIISILGIVSNYYVYLCSPESKSSSGEYNLNLKLVPKENGEEINIAVVNLTKRLQQTFNYGNTDGEEDKIEYSKWVDKFVLNYKQEDNTLHILINTKGGVEFYKYNLNEILKANLNNK